MTVPIYPYLPFKIVKEAIQFKIPFTGKKARIDRLEFTGTVELWVGYGYDLVSRNSNSFAGSVLRRAGVKAPSDVSQQIGFDNDFADWRQWDRAFQSEFQAAVNNRLGM
ncbi:MAG: hypothetical protein A49_13820 [Methyloceanibacter sp.]|nr:MAG: hypothetical protein A49_13820 [Methyloceanibacter sp.]